MRAADLAYRSATVDVVVAQAQDDLNGLFRPLLSDPVERAAQGLREAVPVVAESYGAMAAENAAIWYEDVRPAGARAFRPQTFVPATLAETVGLTTWAVTPLFSGDAASAWIRLAGLLQKAVTDHDRTTIEENADRDPSARGWRRQAAADACAFCAYMAVGIVWDGMDEAAADDKYHDHCRCVPVPLLDGDSLPEQPNHDAWSDTFQAAYQAINDEQSAQYRQWSGRRHDFLRAHQGLTLTTKNILARARRISPDLFRDGVRLAA